VRLNLTTQEAQNDISISKLEAAVAAEDERSIYLLLENLYERGARSSFAAVGGLYESGAEKISVNLPLAFEWYEKGAFLEDDGEGYFAMARFFFTGIHSEQNYERAVKYFQMAYDRKVPEAGIMLGICYWRGYGVPSDVNIAERFFANASQAGYVIAFYFLSRIEYARRHYFLALRFWWKCTREAQILSNRDPQNPKLYYFEQKGRA
jgi:TPR repeat protein